MDMIHEPKQLQSHDMYEFGTPQYGPNSWKQPKPLKIKDPNLAIATLPRNSHSDRVLFRGQSGASSVPGGDQIQDLADKLITEDFSRATPWDC